MGVIFKDNSKEEIMVQDNEEIGKMDKIKVMAMEMEQMEVLYNVRIAKDGDIPLQIVYC